MKTFLKRSKAKFRSARAAWKDIEDATGYMPRQVKRAHTPYYWRWQLKDGVKKKRKRRRR